jgi:hypothetical protein
MKGGTYLVVEMSAIINYMLSCKIEPTKDQDLVQAKDYLGIIDLDFSKIPIDYTKIENKDYTIDYILRIIKDKTNLNLQRWLVTLLIVVVQHKKWVLNVLENLLDTQGRTYDNIFLLVCLIGLYYFVKDERYLTEIYDDYYLVNITSDCLKGRSILFGPVDITYHYIKGKEIYLFGDKHIIGEGCFGETQIPDFLTNVFLHAKDKKMTIDFFLETLPDSENSPEVLNMSPELKTYLNKKHDEKKGDNFLWRTHTKFDKWFQSRKTRKTPQPPYENVRFHHVEIGREHIMPNMCRWKSPNNLFEKYWTGDITKEELIDKQILDLKEFNDIINSTDIYRTFLDRTPNTKIDKQFENNLIDKKIIDEYLKHKLELELELESKDQIFNKIQAQEFHDMFIISGIYDRDKIFAVQKDPKLYEKHEIISHMFGVMLSIFLDYYTIGRIFKNMGREGEYKTQATKIIVYTGVSHSERLRDMLYIIDQTHKYKDFDSIGFQCMDVTNITDEKGDPTKMFKK